MPTRFKSVNRAIKRGHLIVAWREVYTGQNDHITGMPIMKQIPYLKRVISGRNTDHPKTVYYGEL